MITMGISITSNNAFKKLSAKLKADSNKKLEVGIMVPDIATIGMYLEYGWIQSVTSKQGHYLSAQLGLPPNSKFTTLYMPPRPFMRATYAHKRAEWQEIFRKYFLKTFDITYSLKTMGQAAVDDIVQTIDNAGIPAGSFPKRSALTMALFEATGEIAKVRKAKGGGKLANNVNTTKPLTLTGVLRTSIQAKVS